MNKTTLALAALLCAGLVPTLAPRPALAQAQPATPRYNLILQAGKAYFAAQDYAAAQDSAREMLELAASPDEKSQALMLLAESFYRLKDYDQARAQWSQMLDLSETDDDEGTHAMARFGLFRSYTAQGNYKEAIPHLKAVQSYLPTALAQEEEEGERASLTALFSIILADAYYQAGQDELALEQLDLAIGADADSPLLILANLRAAQLDFEQLNLDKARDEYQRVLKQLKDADLDNAKIKPFVDSRIIAITTVQAMQKANPDKPVATFLVIAQAESESRVNFKGKMEADSKKLEVERPAEIDRKLSGIFAEVFDEVFGTSVIGELGD